METWRNVQDEVNELDRLQLISLSWIKYWLLLLITSVASVIYLWSWVFGGTGAYDHFPTALVPTELRQNGDQLFFTSEAEARLFQLKEINFVTFACGFEQGDLSENIQHDCRPATEALVTMKSAAMLSKRVIHFHIFTIDSLYQCFISELDQWPNSIRHRVSFQFHAALFPEAMLHPYISRKSHDKSCQLSYLFVPHLLKELNQVIYVKSGGIFVQSLDELWLQLDQFTEHQVIALPLNSHDSMCKLESDENHTVAHVYDPTVVLMDTYRLRTSVFDVPIAVKDGEDSAAISLPVKTNSYRTEKMTWSPRMLLSFVDLFSKVIQFPEYDVLNLITYFNPLPVNQLPCSWNFPLNIHPSMEAAVSVPQPCFGTCQSVNLAFLSEADDCDWEQFVGLKKIINNASFHSCSSSVLQKDIMKLFFNICSYTSQHNQCLCANLNVLMNALIST